MGNNSYKQAQKPKPLGKIEQSDRDENEKINGAVKQNSKSRAAFAPIETPHGKI